MALTLFMLAGVGVSMAAMCYASGQTHNVVPPRHDGDDSDDEVGVGEQAVAAAKMMKMRSYDVEMMPSPLARGGKTMAATNEDEDANPLPRSQART